MKVFVGGARKISRLSSMVKRRLYNIKEKKYTVLVGDANGVDKAVQNYLFELDYKAVRVFATQGKVRNNIGKWMVECVNVPSNVKGFDYYAAKDKKMAENADYGFMIWNGESKGTLNNIVNLIKLQKKTLLYLSKNNEFYVINTYEQLTGIVDNLASTSKPLLEKLWKQESAIELFT